MRRGCVWRCDDVDVPTRSPFPRPHRWQSKQGHIGPAASAQDPEAHCQPLAPRTPILLSWQDSGSPPLRADGPLEAALRPRALSSRPRGLPGLLLCKHRPLSGCRRLARARPYRTGSAQSGAGRGGAGDSRHLSLTLEPGLVRTPGAREGAALRAGRGARAAPAAAAEERGEERGGGAQGGGEGEGGGARRVPCKAALFIWAQPQPPRWEAQGGRSSPTGELRSGLCREGPGAGCRARGAVRPC